MPDWLNHLTIGQQRLEPVGYTSSQDVLHSYAGHPHAIMQSSDASISPIEAQSLSADKLDLEDSLGPVPGMSMKHKNNSTGRSSNQGSQKAGLAGAEERTRNSVKINIAICSAAEKGGAEMLTGLFAIRFLSGNACGNLVGHLKTVSRNLGQFSLICLNEFRE